MSNAAPGPETPAAAPPATPLAGRAPELLAELAELGMAAARAFQAQLVKAANAGDLDRAVVAEAGFSRSALGVRRAIALDAKLTRQKEQAARQTDDRKRRRRDEAGERRREAAKRVGLVIAKEPDARTRERLTADLWTRLTEDDRIDADSEDTILPLEVLVARLCRQLGLPPGWPDEAGSSGSAESSGDGAANGSSAAAEPRWSPPPPPPIYDYTPGRYVLIRAADLGLEGDKVYNLNKTTGEVFDPDTGKLFRVLSTGPEPDTGPPEATPPETGPPQPESVPPPLAGGGQGEGVASTGSGPPDEDAERRRQEHRLRQEEARKFGLTLPDLP